ncbi:MAG: hypothetical protein B6I25_08290 [Planctomycetales bacterium 4572_13]|nr:MAG: hypothetical protein B6I25_08290 [Planctomycetales bacterium 4572_13]
MFKMIFKDSLCCLAVLAVFMSFAAGCSAQQSNPEIKKGVVLTEGMIVSGPDEVRGKMLGELGKWFVAGADGEIMLTADAPNGRYNIHWSVNCPAGAKALEISADLLKHNQNQGNSLSASCDGGETWQQMGSNTPKSWVWEKIKSDLLVLSAPPEGKILIRWGFNKPHDGNIWRVGIQNIKIEVGDEEAAIARYREPAAVGLPQRLDPRIAKKPWTSKLEIKDNMMLKDGKPFFPIGFNYGVVDRDLAQVKAMGCNALTYDVGWRECPKPGIVGEEAFERYINLVRNAAKWDVVYFPILAGHYVPGWFLKEHDSNKEFPLGSDGKKTGHWMKYSLHYEPFREHVVNYWKSVMPVLEKESNIMATSFWNEPSYGGSWAWSDQFGDYRPYAIDDYREHLKKKYNSLATLKRAHRQSYTSFETLQPPRKPDEFGRVAWLDWMEYGQEYFADFYNWEREVIHSVAPKARLNNKKQTNIWDNSTASSGTNWHLMQESEDIFGINAYISSVFAARNIFDGARSYANGKPVVVFETNAMPPNADARTADVVRCQLWAQILGGARGVFLFMFNADRQHGLVSDTSVKPEVRPEYVRFTSTISKHQRQLASPHVPARIAVIYSTPAALQYPDNTVPKNVIGAFNMFRNSHYQTDILPSERCTPEGLAEYELIVLPSYCILKKPEIKAINGFVAKGGKLMSFAKSLATDEYLNTIKPLKFQGIETRSEPIGGRTDQELSWVSPKLAPYEVAEATVTGIEKVSQIANDPAKIIQGIAIEAKQKGTVLVMNRDSYAAILLAPGDNVVYCAFESNYSPEIRGLVEGITREYLGIKQKVRMTRDEMVDPGIMTSLRQDYKDPDRRYLLVMNTKHRPRTLELELDTGWKIEREYFHGLDALGYNPQGESATVRLPKREVFLFELIK